ncbi:MAG: hypothetical protein WCH84_07110 [Verrucomicrobiota bacterium]
MVIRTKRKIFLRVWQIASSAILLFICTASWGSGIDTKVFYGGFAFAGKASEVEKNYPIAVKLNAADAQAESFFGAQARDFFKVNANSFSKIDLQFGLARPEDTPLVLALALTDEKVLREQLGSFHKLVIQLGFELLVLDFRAMEVAVSRPIYIELIDASRVSFSDEDVVSRMRKMIEGKDSQLFSTILKKAGDFQIRGRNQSTLQIRAVSVGEKALPFLPDAYRQSTNTYAQAIAQQFGALLAGEAGLAMLPYAKDALNSKMSLRFADASMVQFKIPSPTFAVDVDLKGYKKILDKSTAAESLWLYGAFLGLRIYEPEFNVEFFNAPVKFGVPKVVPASQQTVDEFPIVSEALQGAFLEAIQQMQKDKNTKTKVLNKCKL